MNYREWVASQFELRMTEDGRVCFKTPCSYYTFSKEDFEIIREMFLNFESRIHTTKSPWSYFLCFYSF